MEKKIVIIGAGYSGILTAKKLEKKFRKNKDVTITVIDKNPFHTMLTELHEVAAARVEEESIRVSLKRVFAGRRIDLKHDRVNSIDFTKKLVFGSKENYSYDYLVISAGSKPTFFGVEGASQNSYKLWSYEDAVILKEHILNSFRKAFTETNLEEKRRLLTFHIVGAGFTGAEMAGELAEYIPILCDHFEIDRELVSVTVVDILTRTVPTLPEKLSVKVEKRLRKMGVRILLNTGVTAIGSDFIEMKINNEVRRERTETVVWCAGIEASDITGKAAQDLKSGGRGRIVLDPYLRSVDNESVYVVGDNMLYTPKGEDRPVPMVVENCEQSADTAVHNIVCSVTGKGEMEEYRPKFHGIMVSIGGRYGVAHVGTPKRMFSLASFFAMFVKHFINLVYFVQLLGWNKCFSYMRHEFFTVRNCRSFVGGHLSNRTPSFLLVPLRVFLGAVWLFEGVMKIVEGWFNSPQLIGFFNGANGWYNNILNGGADGTSGATAAAEGTGEAVAQAADAVTAATAAGGEAVKAVGTAILNFDFLGLFRLIFVSGKDLAHSTISDYAFKVDIPLMNSFLEKFILPNNTMQMIMQIFIVSAEILVGLALIGGLFTTPAAAFSLILQAMFVTTTGLYLGSFWMIFAGIALLIAAGRIIGLDYYAMPYLKGKWKKVKFARKWYLYND